VRYLRRHRLEKKDPGAAVSEPVKPIQYWVDSGAPDDVKKALVEGASWWNQAFDAAGFRNAFKVDVLPDGADPMDIRYNMINWVHRSTRGWSSGGTVSDPRTGEIIKATVTLGSLRDRQDYLIFEGLFPPGTEEQGALTKILDDAWAEDLRYMTNQDTDSHPKVDQWSYGVDQADELNRLMKVRRSALNRLGEHTIRAGAPMATIEEPLVPIFMYHRYAVESTASMVAGQDYIY